MLKRILALRRRHPFSRRVARWCHDMIAAYENLNFNLLFNGEQFVVRTMAEAGVERLFDVGANVGSWTRMARGHAPTVEVHCFEVLAATFAELESNLGGRDGVILNAFGLGAAAAEIELHTFVGASGLTTATEFPHDRPRQSTTGRVDVGDEYVRRHGIDRIDLLKIDVEGMGRAVLDGFAQTLESGRITAVQFEYGQVNILTRVLLRDYYELFEGYGYAIGKIYPNYVEFRPYDLAHENFIGSNHLAVRRERGDLIRALTNAS